MTYTEEQEAFVFTVERLEEEEFDEPWLSQEAGWSDMEAA